MRCYLYIAWTEEGYELAYFHPGYIRRSLIDYSTVDEDSDAQDLT